MENKFIAIASTLIDIEKELRALRLWTLESLPPEAFASTQPFAVDTMTFPQWLQFIFLPRMKVLVMQQLPLPVNCNIAPMAEHYFAALDLHSAPLIHHLHQIDTLLSAY